MLLWSTESSSPATVKTPVSCYIYIYIYIYYLIYFVFVISFLFLAIYIYTYIHMYVCIYIYIHIHIHICIIYIYIHMFSYNVCFIIVMLLFVCVSCLVIVVFATVKMPVGWRAQWLYFIGGANNNFNNLHVRKSLETNTHLWNGNMAIIELLLTYETQVVEIIV